MLLAHRMMCGPFSIYEYAIDLDRFGVVFFFFFKTQLLYKNECGTNLWFVSRQSVGVSGRRRRGARRRRPGALRAARRQAQAARDHCGVNHTMHSLLIERRPFRKCFCIHDYGTGLAYLTKKFITLRCLVKIQWVWVCFYRTILRKVALQLEISYFCKALFT